EEEGFSRINGSSLDCMYALSAALVINTNFQSTNQYNHYSFLQTLETVWNLPPLTNNDRNATPMMEFFAVHAHHGQAGHEGDDGELGSPNVEDHQDQESRRVCDCKRFYD